MRQESRHGGKPTARARLREIWERSIPDGELGKEALEVAERSHRRGFSGIWGIARKFSITHGLLVPDRSVERFYFPAATPEILREFQPLSKLNTDGLRRAVLAFAKQWGHLGYDHLPDNRQLGGDPLGWIRAQASAVGVVLQLLHMARNGSDKYASTFLHELDSLLDQIRELEMEDWEAIASWDGDWRVCGVALFAQEIALAPRWEPKPNSRGHALRIAINVIGKNIANIRPLPALDQGQSRIRLSFVFNALVEIIWWHVMELAAGGSVLRICPNCENVFVASRPNQVYCPPPEDDPATESLCAARYRMRKYREKRKQEGV